jgi:formylglycine-generating enzyme required for sulfatase activity
MPIDADPGDVAGTGLAVRDLTEQLRGSGAGNVILLIDACRDDGSRDGVGIGLEQQQGVITLFSCAPEQQSYEVDELQAGAFTHALLQGLRIQGEGNCATVARLAEHVRVQVPYLTQLYRKGPQNPYLVAEPVSKQNLILLPRQATPTDVLMLKNGALQAENQGDPDLARDFWLRVLSVSSGSDMEAVQAIERLASGNLARRGVGNAGGSRSASPSLPPVISRRRLIQLGWGGLGTVGFGLVGKAWSGGQNQLPTPRPPQIDKPIAPKTPVVPETPAPKSSPTETPKPKEPKAQSGIKLEDFQFETVQLSDAGKEIKREKLTRKLFNHQIAVDVSLPMVQIPAGKFLMGSPDSEAGRSKDEGPQHEVSVSAFFMSQTPITQAQWKAVAKLQKVNIDLDLDPSKFKGDRRPVEQVSWWEAQEFCDRLFKLTGLTYRLPSEAEWEFACRSGTKTPFYFGEPITAEVANYDSNNAYGNAPKAKSPGQTTDVKTYPANAWGLYDMHGNVWEWCADYWHDTYDNAPIDGSVWLNSKTSYRLLRGGSWDADPGNCRSTIRNEYEARGNYDGNVGFRVVCLAV